MYFQIIEYGVYHDILLLMRFFAVIIIFYMVFQVGKKKKDTDIFSATTGFAIYLISLAIFHFLIAIPYLYDQISPDLFYYIIINTIFICGMVSFIFFTELDKYINGSHKNQKIRSFLLSIISSIGASILGILALFQVISIIFAFVFVGLPIFIATKIFLIKYKTFVTIRRSKIIEFFYTGLILSGFSNFLMIGLFISYFGYWIVLVLNTLLIITGSLLTSWAWNKLPSLSELDWMLKLERLLVFHSESSRLMYHYDFQVGERRSIEQTGEVLVSSVIGGLNMILKEILSSNGYINEISHGDKNLIFSHGNSTACILITLGTSSELKYRLKMFHLSFEKQFEEEHLENWNGILKPFEKATDLVMKFFSS
jgi:hypothetical protein